MNTYQSQFNNPVYQLSCRAAHEHNLTECFDELVPKKTRSRSLSPYAFPEDFPIGTVLEEYRPVHLPIMHREGWDQCAACVQNNKESQ